jgi:hypothetical protein
MNPFTSKHMTMAKSKGASAAKKCSPLKKIIVKPKDTEIEKTANYDKGVKRYAANKTKMKGDTGIDVNQTTGVASAKPYEKKYVPSSKSNPRASIISGANKTVGQSKGYDKYSEKNLRKKFVADSTDTMKRRNANANFYNVQAGKKKDLTEEDKKSLVGLNKAKVVRR